MKKISPVFGILIDVIIFTTLIIAPIPNLIPFEDKGLGFLVLVSFVFVGAIISFLIKIRIRLK